MKQYIAYPICWELNFDKNRHSMRVYECFHQNKKNITGEIPAAISDTESSAKTQIINNAVSYFRDLRNIHTTIAQGDVVFGFMVKEILDGNVSLTRNMLIRETI